jgi:hypothetical protein
MIQGAVCDVFCNSPHSGSSHTTPLGVSFPHQGHLLGNRNSQTRFRKVHTRYTLAFFFVLTKN